MPRRVIEYGLADAPMLIEGDGLDMIELPEALTLAKQLSEAVAGRTVSRVLPPAKPHKFCWFNGEPSDYEEKLRGSRVTLAEGFGIYAELGFDNGCRLCVNDGVNLRLMPTEDAPNNYQLLIAFADGDALVFTVAMYGGIILHGGNYDNEYYLKSRAAVSPFGPDFRGRFEELLAGSKPSLSAKAFLATEQRFPGIGNGVCQDILFAAGINPRRRLDTMDSGDRDRLYSAVVDVLRDMTAGGGRDTEKNIYGQPGGYATKMSKNAMGAGCPRCGGRVVRESYLGGSVYYCPECQPL